MNTLSTRDDLRAVAAHAPQEQAIHAVGVALADLLDDLDAKFPGAADEAAARLGATLLGKGGKASAAVVPRGPERAPRGWLSTRDAAAYTSDDPTTIRKAAEAGELVGSQRTPGRSPWKFRVEDLDRWVANR